MPSLKFFLTLSGSNNIPNYEEFQTYLRKARYARIELGTYR